MSDLYKKALKNQKKPEEEEENDSDYDEIDDYDEGMMEGGNFQDKYPGLSSGGPVKPMPQSLPPKVNQNQKFMEGQSKGMKGKINNYTPMKWDEFFDTVEYTQQGTPIYKAGNEGIIFLCLHGAGDSGTSFAQVAKQVKQFGSLVSFDFKGHGLSKKTQNLQDLSVNALIEETYEVFNYLQDKYPDPTFVIVGHSMGGAIATKFAQDVYNNNKAERVVGLIVIDVVEGTAMEALPFMKKILEKRPTKFQSYEQLIDWSIKSNTLRNSASARVSMPSKVVEVKDNDSSVHYEWRVNLKESEQHWVEWFKGLTKSFLDTRLPKLLMTAEKERMDTDLTIGQMQGKFKLSVLFNVGHYMQEDDYFGTATQFHQFLTSFRVPHTVQDQQKLKEFGVGKFTPQTKPYKPQ